jgi:CDGSH-type Zn-finger protein
VIEGPAVIVDAEGNRFAVPTDKSSIALCRCGHSRRKPFCDGAHRECGFSARERATRTL